MRTALNNMLKLSGLAVLAIMSAQCTPEDLGPAAPTQFDLPDLVVKPVDFLGTKSIISEDGLVKIDEKDDLQVFVENSADEVTVWEDVAHRYISSDAANNVFKPETPFVVEDVNARINLYAMSPYSEAVIDPIGGTESATAFTFDGQVQDCKNLRAHLTAYDIMTGTVKNVIAGQKPEIQLEHKAAMVHFSIQNALRRPVTVQSVELIAPEGVMIGGAYSIQFKNGGSLTPITGTNTLTLDLENAELLGADDSFDVYFMTPSFNLLAGDELKLHVISDNGDWTKAFAMEEDRSFVAGSLNEAVAERPQYTVDILWTKNASEMGFAGCKNSGTALNDKYVAVNEWGGDVKKDQFILLNREDGSVVKQVPTATTFTCKVRTDDAGHFVVNRENIYGAGFVIYVYNEADGSFQKIMNYPAGDNCPLDMGYNMNVAGNLVEGEGYIYGMAPADSRIFSWKVTDGVPDADPTVIDCAQIIGKPWFRANIQRMSTAADSQYYFSYIIKGANKKEGGSQFGIASPNFEMTMMEPSNSCSRVTRIFLSLNEATLKSRILYRKLAGSIMVISKFGEAIPN